MPIYAYLCNACGHEAEEFQKITSMPLDVCPKCGVFGVYHRVPTAGGIRPDFHKPIEMLSIALNDNEEIAAFTRLCPDVQVETDENHPLYGVPVARNRAQKVAALKAMGFAEKN